MSTSAPPPPPEMVPSSIPVSPPRPPPPAPAMSLSPPPPLPPSAPADVQSPQVAPLAPPPKPVHAEPQQASEDWQTGFCWAFIVKFHGDKLVGKNNLNTVMDLEYALMTEGHNEILSTVFQQFILAFRPAIKDINDRTMPKHLLRVIDHCMAFPSLSVYHDLKANSSSATTLLLTGEKDAEERRALNPIRRLFEDTREPGEPSEHGRGDGINGEDNVGRRIWMMDWKEKLKLLRQLVDWQLAHAESIRAAIQDNYKMGHQKQTDFNPETNQLVIRPIGNDRKKRRYWSFDDSPRIYHSTNPYKKICPLVPVTSSKSDLRTLIADFRSPISSSVLADYDHTIALGGPAGKKARSAKAAEEKGKAGEMDMARWIEDEHMPKIEAQEQKLERARRKAEQAAIAAAQVDVRSSRTRRSTRRPNYTNGGTNYEEQEEEEESDNGSSTSFHSSRNGGDAQEEWRGERRSTRTRLRDDRAAMDVDGGAGGDDDDGWEKIPAHLLNGGGETNGGGSGAGDGGDGDQAMDGDGDEDVYGSEAGSGSEYGVKVEGDDD